MRKAGEGKWEKGREERGEKGGKRKRGKVGGERVGKRQQEIEARNVGECRWEKGTGR